MIYTDSQTHSYAQEIFQGFPWHRYELINLDLDPRDALRMAPFRREDFDDKNWASVRRTLADCDHLDVRKLGQRLFLHFWLRKGRLLLGTDVKFLQRPLNFIEAAQSLREQQATYCMRKAKVLAQAVYMVDRFWQGETPDGQPVSNVTLVARGSCHVSISSFFLAPRERQRLFLAAKRDFQVRGALHLAGEGSPGIFI